MGKKISVVLATLNSGSTLEKCLLSIKNQIYPDVEIIVIDGGSNDNTIEILENYKEIIAYWVSEPDRGIYHAWNKALERVTGDWICFLGSDDQWSDPNAISDLMSVGVRDNCDIVSGRLAFVDRNGSVVGIKGEPWSWPAIKRSHVIAHPGMIHHRSVFLINGRYSEKYKIAGDYEFSLRLGKDVRAGFIDRVLVKMGNSGISNSRVNQVLKEVFLIQVKHPEISMFAAIRNFLIGFVVINLKKKLFRL